MPNGPAPAPQALILSEIRDQSDKLYQQLRSLIALSRSLVAGAVSAALFAFLNWPDDIPISDDFGELALYTMALLVLLGMFVEAGAERWWRSDINDLVQRYFEIAHMPQAGTVLELALLMTLSSNLEDNKRLVLSTKRRVAAQTYATIAAGLLLFAVLLGRLVVT